MAPIAIGTPARDQADGVQDITTRIANLKAQLKENKGVPVVPPENTLKRYLKAGIDLSGGYPYYPPKPKFVQDVEAIRTNLREYVDPGTRADPEKKALFGAAKEVRNLTINIGVRRSMRGPVELLIRQTEIVGLQLKDLTDQQKDELALLVAERSVVCKFLLVRFRFSVTWLTVADAGSLPGPRPLPTTATRARSVPRSRRNRAPPPSGTSSRNRWGCVSHLGTRSSRQQPLRTQQTRPVRWRAIRLAYRSCA